MEVVDTDAATQADTARTWEPYRTWVRLQKAPIEELHATWMRAGDAAGSIAIARLIAIGIALERAEYGDNAAEKIGKEWGIGAKRAQRLAKAFRHAVKPKLVEQGENATFILPETSWYELCAEAAPICEKPAIELLEHAEQSKIENPKYSLSMFRREMGLDDPDEGSTASDAKSLWRTLKKLAGFDDSAIADAAKDAKALAHLDHARDALVAAQRVVEELEALTVHA